MFSVYRKLIVLYNKKGLFCEAPISTGKKSTTVLNKVWQ